MQITCPHCQNPIELSEVSTRSSFVCPACGASFKLADDVTVTMAPQGRQRLGRFELLQAIGEGGFGTVFKALDTELNRTVAVKVPRAGNLPEKHDLERFLREARSVAQLQHPSIVSVHEAGQVGDIPYLVSDYIDGLTLSDLLSGRRLTMREAAELVAEVADALQYAHEKGIVHRDIKPSNIMLDTSTASMPSGTSVSALPGRVRLMDFGLAKRDVGEVTVTAAGEVLGTPAYMSPEQARGEAHRVDGRADIYSLGVILYQMLTGELPYRGTTRMLLHQVLNEEPRAPRRVNDSIPRDVETVCLKAMAKEPGRRYQTAREFAEDLRRFMAGEPVLARPVGSLGRSWRWCKRNPAVASLIAAVTASLLGGVAGASWFAVQADENARRATSNE